jgi:hypothetical protein
VFAEWLGQIEGKALALIANSPQDAHALAAGLNISEESAIYLLSHLAQSGKITLSGHAKS